MSNRTRNFLISFCYFFANHFALKYFPYRARHSFLVNFLGYRIGSDSTFCYGVFVTGSQISVGSNTVINRFSYLDGRGGLLIGNNVNISHYTLIQTLTHDYNSPVFQAFASPVEICDDVWIGARAIILPGVKLGKGCVVGAGSVVTRDVPDYAVVAGSPAKQVATRTDQLNYKTRYRPYFSGDIQ